MPAKKQAVDGGLDGLGAVAPTKPSPKQPAVEHQYGTGGLDYLGSVDLQDLGVEELKTKKEQALQGLDLLGTGEPVDWAWYKDVVFSGIRLTSGALEILSDPQKHPSELRKLLRLLVELIDLIDKRK